MRRCLMVRLSSVLFDFAWDGHPQRVPSGTARRSQHLDS
jgi:hypothetical protein